MHWVLALLWAVNGLTPSRTDTTILQNESMGPNAIREYEVLSGCLDTLPPVQDNYVWAKSVPHWDLDCFVDELS